MSAGCRASLALGLALGACTSGDTVGDADADDTAVTADVAGGADATAATDTSAPADAVEPHRVRVVQLNLRCLVDGWDARLPIIASELAALDPDLMGFEEVCAETGGRDALTELTAALTARTGRAYATHRAVTHRAWDKYDEGLAIASALPIADTATVALPTGTFPRKVILARATSSDGATLDFAVTHLDHLNAATRKSQATAAAAALAGHAQPGEPRVLVGDLNEGPGGGVHEALVAAGLFDLWAALHPGEAGPTFPSSGPTERIDYVWLDAAGSGLAAESIARVLDAAVGGVFGSDHLGVEAVLAR